MTEKHRIGIVGGTFDPPHIGHLLLGECARAGLGLARIHYVPAGDPYHKADRAVTPASHRLAMVQLAIAGQPDFVADDRDVRRDGPTYTIDTLREMRDDGFDNLVLVLGADTIPWIDTWKEWRAIEDLATLAIAPKEHTPGDVLAMARETGLRREPEIVDMPELTVNSTLIRGRLRAGKPVKWLVPDAVLQYAQANELYT